MRKLRQKKKRKSLAVMVRLFFLTAIITFFSTILIVRQGFFNNSRLISPVSDSFPKKEKNVDNNSIKRLESALTKNNIKFSSVSVASDSSYLINLEDKGNIIFDFNKSLDLQISSLQLMLSRFTIEGKRIERVDFRFDKPIVVFKK